MAMLAYRSSPQFGKYSPAELLMGRKLRTTVVTHPDNLVPELPDHSMFKAQNDTYKMRMKENHDNNCKVQPLKPVEKGTLVHIRDNNKEGTVLVDVNDNTRSALVQCQNDKPLRRNRSAIVPIPSKEPTTTRSGRISKPPKYLEDYERT